MCFLYSYGVYEFMPIYMFKGKTVTQVRDELTNAIKTIAPSYGVFRPETLAFMFKNYPFLNEIAPINNIPEASKRAIPCLWAAIWASLPKLRGSAK